MSEVTLPVLMTIRQTADMLKGVSSEDAALEARYLVASAMSTDHKQLLADGDRMLTHQEQERLALLVKRRLAHEPVQYILEEWEFMGLPIAVRQGALIPRQDTEILAETALQLAKERACQRVLDLCCGTGCIGISLARLGGLEVTASDISPLCVALTGENAKRNGVKLRMLTGDLFSCIEGRFDLIVSNPPYLTGEDMRSLQAEVRFEPRLALDGGPDGLDVYRRIAEAYRSYLRPGGVLLLEAGIRQAEDVAALFQAPARFIKDYNGIKRVVIIEGYYKNLC